MQQRRSVSVMRLAIAVILALLVAVPDGVAQTHCRAVDGDTLRCGDERVRIMGLDTPELHGRCLREEHLARRARERMAELVAGGVTLRPRGRDRYRRLLATVTDNRGRDVAVVMIREGLARPYRGERRQSWCGA